MKIPLTLLLALLFLHPPALAQQAGEPPPAPSPAEVAQPTEIEIMSAPEADPAAPRGLRVREPEAWDGYTLFAPLNSRSVHLIDLDGEVVHTWPTDSAPGAWVYLLEDGTLLRCGREDEDPHFAGGGIGGRIQKLAPDGTILWHWQLADLQRQQHHDLEPLPNGNVLVIAWERIAREEAIARGRDPRQVGPDGLWPDVILEVQPAPPAGGEIVWQWRAWDHIVQDFDSELAGYGAVPDHPERIDVNGDHRDAPPLSAEERRRQQELEDQMRALGYVGGEEEAAGAEDAEGEELDADWLHTNAVDYHAGLDLIVLSTPRFDELWVIDHSTSTAEAAGQRGGRFGKGGDILWRWGHPKRYGAGEDADQRLFAQHDPTWLDTEDGGLRLLVFNNGRGRPGGDHSSVDELVLPFDPERGFVREPGRPFGPAAPAWSYADPGGFFSAFISGAQRLPNGNTLVCSGAAGRLFEVTRDGRIVWDYRNPHGGEIDPPEHAGRAPALALFRGTRLAPDHPGVKRVLAQ